MEIVCSKLDGHTRILVQTKVRYAPAHCEPSGTNIVGACWSSTHDPEDASDHLPSISETVEQFSVNCPAVTNLVVKIGYTHNPLLVHIRNLVRILTRQDADDLTDHCLGVVWVNGGSMSLSGLIEPQNLPETIAGKIHFHILDSPTETRNANNYAPNGLFSFGKKPSKDTPTIRLVSMCYGEDHKLLDNMWIVVNSPDTRAAFDAWKLRYASTTWANSLPQPFDKIPLVTNSVTGVVSPGDPEPGAPNEWCAPTAPETYLHHNAVYEMRTETDIPGDHGHQATYDANGILIRSAIASGTADYRKPYTRVLWSTETIPRGFAHRDADVIPFIMALQLDGNPVLPRNTWRTLDRPCLYRGDDTDAYIARRPVLPSGVQVYVP